MINGMGKKVGQEREIHETEKMNIQMEKIV